MGMYRSVYMDLACERCGAMRREEVQFKTGADRLQVYSAGDRVGEDDGLRRGERYGGVADRYCEACWGDWMRAEARATHEVLARFVEEGRLAVLDASGSPVSAEALRRRAPEYAAALSADDIRHRRCGPHPILAGYRALWEGAEARTFPHPGLDFFPALNRQVDRLLRYAGWPRGWETLRHDLVVFIDDAALLRVDALAPAQ